MIVEVGVGFVLRNGLDAEEENVLGVDVGEHGGEFTILGGTMYDF